MNKPTGSLSWTQIHAGNWFLHQEAPECSPELVLVKAAHRLLALTFEEEDTL